VARKGKFEASILEIAGTYAAMMQRLGAAELDLKVVRSDYEHKLALVRSEYEHDLAVIRSEYERYIAFHNQSEGDLEKRLAERTDWARCLERELNVIRGENER
jgi:hypothetical protein